ncbi:MAG: efflux RND transporter periplasmic adaptor subunit [Tropicimonas sp.]|uniref:efflux RND transporter periplasmic adaptor subunit n=1 Tax=Tropicimonas sp. TaxID=2067044 RepID=UPI003A87E8E6
MKLLSLLAAGLLLAACPPAPAETITLAPVEVTEMKALFGSVESRFVIPARTRIGGTLVALDVSEGSAVRAGQVIARITDDKLALQLEAAEAHILSAQAQLENAEAELQRNTELLNRGATTAQQLDQIRTSANVARNARAEAGAARAVILQQMQEGAVLAPADGRVLAVPMRQGQVVLPGEAVATIAGGGVFLRLRIPERHADGLAPGAAVELDGAAQGRIDRIYPEIANGRVTADATVPGLPGDFIGKRVLVRVPVARRQTLALPAAAIHTRSGLDMVEIETGGTTTSVIVVPGAMVATPAGEMREILSGLRSGDRVIVP